MIYSGSPSDRARCGHDWRTSNSSVLVEFLAELSQLADGAPTMLVVLPLVPTEILKPIRRCGTYWYLHLHR